MVLLTVQEDGRIQIPKAVRERLGLYPGTQLALEEGGSGGSIHLSIMAEEAQLIEEEEGIWTIRCQSSDSEDPNIDWIERIREERIATLQGSQ
jgi:AbrB family looped-hinge helix DNA binding protein